MTATVCNQAALRMKGIFKDGEPKNLLKVSTNLLQNCATAVQ